MVTILRGISGLDHADMDQHMATVSPMCVEPGTYQSQIVAATDAELTTTMISIRQPPHLESLPQRGRLPTVLECTHTADPKRDQSHKCRQTPTDSRICPSKGHETIADSENQRTRKCAIGSHETSACETFHRTGHQNVSQMDTTSTRIPELPSRGTPTQNLLQKESSFINTAKKDVSDVDRIVKPVSQRTSRLHKKKVKKSIFISYSPDAGFLEKKFVVESVRQLKENNLAEDIWFDKDEKITDNPCWLSMRMEAMEKCKAAVLIISDSYLSCPVSVYESKALLERHSHDCSAVVLYTILYELTLQIPKVYSHLIPHAVDLTHENVNKSLAEKSSIVVGALMEELERHASIHAPLTLSTPPGANFTGNYKHLRISEWQPNDIQEWLFHMGIKEFYQQSFAEFMVDGFLLMAITDHDMIYHLSIDSRAVRKKIMQAMLVALDREQRLPDNWHLRARAQRTKPAAVYIIYDPADVRLAQSLKQDLSKKNLQVSHHQQLGESKEEFLRLNSHLLATATTVLLLLTEAANNSPFVFHEVLFSDWLGKRIVAAMFKNIWSSLRPSLKTVLGDCHAVDFEKKMYVESLDVLVHHIKPKNVTPVFILEQTYLTKMTEGVQPLSVLASANTSGKVCHHDNVEPSVVVCYQWDAQSVAEQLCQLLEAAGITCWADASPTAALTRNSNSGLRMRSGGVTGDRRQGMQYYMRAACAVVPCITIKYVQSEIGARELGMAEALAKPIVPVMLRFTQWPPEGAPPQLRRLLARYTPIDMSNDKLFRQNTPMFVDRLRRLVTAKA